MTRDGHIQAHEPDAPSGDGLEMEVEALRARYRAERDKRMRSEGNSQYRAPTGDFAHFVEDPYADASFRREPVTDRVDVAIVGGGFAGLLAGAHLRMAGIEDVWLIEKAGDFGGTWYWNRYPGLQCDIESYIYLPLLEETGYVPTERYARGAEIWEHARRIARHFDLYRDALFQTQVTALDWDEMARRWTVTTDRGDRIAARFVIQTNGLLDRPKLPAIAGIETFEGHSFHSSRWDHGYTGADLSGLADKRVAVIGTGATAIQVIPHVARHAQKLYVVQRTPSSVDVRGNRPTDMDWFATLAPGWQRRRAENFVALTSGLPQETDLVGDGWTDAVRNVGGFGGATGDLRLQREIADFRKMNALRARIEAEVTNPAYAESLKPWYRQFCKRPTFSDEYLPTFNRPNVELIDTDGRGLDRFSETGIVFDDVEYPVDCAIFATGFDYGSSYSPTAAQRGHPIRGRDGLSLDREWRDGLRTLHGFYCSGFPNLFQMGGSQNGVAFITTYYLGEQAEHIASLIRHAQDLQATLIEPTRQAEAEWVAIIRAKDKSVHDFQRECTPGFYNDEGKVGETFSRADETYGEGPVAFYQLIRQWRMEGMQGLRFE